MEELKPKVEDIKLPYRVPTDLNVWVWWFCFVVVLVLSILGTVSILLEGMNNLMNWMGALFVLLAFPFMILKLGPALLLTEESLSYREFFKHQKVNWSAIQKVDTTASITTKFVLKGGMMEMDIYHNSMETPNPIAINLKVFTKKGLTTLGEILAQKASQAEFDEKTVNLGKGIMPSLF